MSKEDELKQRVRESGTLTERLESCRERIGKMCKEGRPPKMTIPVQWCDDDFFISVTLQDAIAAQKSVERTGGHVCPFCGKPTNSNLPAHFMNDPDCR